MTKNEMRDSWRKEKRKLRSIIEKQRQALKEKNKALNVSQRLRDNALNELRQSKRELDIREPYMRIAERCMRGAVLRLAYHDNGH